MSMSYGIIAVTVGVFSCHHEKLFNLMASKHSQWIEDSGDYINCESN